MGRIISGFRSHPANAVKLRDRNLRRDRGFLVGASPAGDPVLGYAHGFVSGTFGQGFKVFIAVNGQ